MMEPPQPRTVGIWSPGVRRVPHLAAFLGAERLRFRPLLRSVEAWAGWGRFLRVFGSSGDARWPQTLCQRTQ